MPVYDISKLQILIARKNIICYPSLPPSLPPSLHPFLTPSLPPSHPPSLPHTLPPSLPIQFVQLNYYVKVQYPLKTAHPLILCVTNRMISFSMNASYYLLTILSILCHLSSLSSTCSISTSIHVRLN